MFRTVPLSIISSFSLSHSNGICHAGLLTACEQDQDGQIPDDGQRNCPKHVEFYSKNKFEKLVHVVDFIIRKLNCAVLTGNSAGLRTVLSQSSFLQRTAQFNQRIQ